MVDALNRRSAEDSSCYLQRTFGLCILQEIHHSNALLHLTGL
jgi:hypothetical protein